MPIRLIKETTHIDFLSHWKWAALFSAGSLLAGVIAYFLLGGFRYGIDFLGGTVVQVKFAESHDLGEIRSSMAEANIGSFDLQAFGEEGSNEILISLAAEEEKQVLTETSLGQHVQEALVAKYPGLEIRRVETVGPKVGDELRNAAIAAIAFSVLAIMLYVWLRFEWRYGVAALVATAHDVAFVLAVFIVIQHEITLSVVASVLTVAGYSINDKIVIMDRVRDNLRLIQKMSYWDLVNASINETLSRTILTGGTVIFALLSILFLGGETLSDFALGLLIGIMVGTYSSIYVGSPVLVLARHWVPPVRK